MKNKRFADTSGNGFSAAIEGGVTAVEGGVQGRAAQFDGTGYLRVEEPAVFNAPDVTVAFWMKPTTVTGRRGLVSKRFAGTAAPFVISQNGASLSYEAAEEGNGVWTFNFHSPVALQQDQWTHVAAVAQRGVGARIYVQGKLIAEKANAADRATNTEPLILGREAWGGDPPSGQTPGPYRGLLDEVKIWTRALTPEEIQAQSQAGVPSRAPLSPAPPPR